MDTLTEKGLIINIMSYLDNNNCCKMSSVLKFGLTNTYYLKILKDQKKFMISKYKYYKLCKNTKNLLNDNLEYICTYCNNICQDGLRMLLRECRHYYLENNLEIGFDLYLNKKGTTYLHFDTKHECERFKLDCTILFPKVNYGDTCCEGKGFQLILKNI